MCIKWKYVRTYSEIDIIENNTIIILIEERSKYKYSFFQ